MNEVTYHYLDTIYTHLFNTKGPLPGKASVGGGAAVAQPMNVSALTAPFATLAFFVTANAVLSAGGALWSVMLVHSSYSTLVLSS